MSENTPNANGNQWHKIVNLLSEKNLTIATMESCTGGGVANAITSVSGASSVIKESYITYCNESKIKQGVPADIIAKFSVYSKETAEAMANAVKKQANSDFGVGVTGQLGRIDPNNPVDKLNCVWYAIINQKNQAVVKMLNVPNEDRPFQKEFVIRDISDSLLDILKN
ncbi:MAG: CinA family protein [Clostridia bacterium]|nr:CinA family protein [Clostridia bacterium]